jgi:macrodomain Ter protein organizer (MatP/YcbG family)
MPINKLSSNRNKSKAKDLSVEEQEQALAKIKKRKGESKKTQRVTVDFTYQVYGDMKEVVEEEGKTLRGYIVSLVKKDLKKKDS